MNTSSSNPNPTHEARQQLDAAISRFQSTDQKRIALRKALQSRPEDAHLNNLFQQLTSADEIKEALSRGIFVNYARSDELFVIDLVERLRQASLHGWVDILDAAIGKDWYGEIKRALQESGFMIAVMSSASLTDPDASVERQKFAELGKLILPIKAGRVDLSEFDFWLDPIDFSRDFEHGLYNLYRTLGVQLATA